MKKIIEGFLTMTLAGRTAFAEPSFKDKTLVAWVSLGNLNQRGGIVLTIEDAQKRFDGIVFGELAPGKWRAGRENYARSQMPQAAWPAETADAETLVQVADVYRDGEAVFYRNGEEYGSHPISEPPPFDSQSTITIGPRHLGKSDFFAGAVEDARIYDRALTVEAFASQVPGSVRRCHQKSSSLAS